MLTLFSIILIILSILLILIILIQPGKSDMIAGMTGISSQFNSVLGTKGATNMLTRVTFGFAIAIIALSLVTNLFFTKASSTGGFKKAATEGRVGPKVTNTAAPTAQPQGGAAAQPQPQPQGEQKK
jgi:preprotein translocase subunit SecG